VENIGKFRLGEWMVEPALNRIIHGDTRVNLQPQVMNLLVYLARHANEVVSAEELLAKLWGGKVVTGSSIYVALMELRKSLGDDTQNPRYITTIPKRGYRLIAEVEFPPEYSSSGFQSTVGVRDSVGGHPWRKTALVVAMLVLVFYAAFLFRDDPAQPDVPPLASVPKHSVAVLPFVDMSPEQDQGWFGDGIAEEILNKLAQIPGLKVTGRSSSFAFREPVTDIRTIAHTLGVAYLLEGSVRRDGNRVRVTAQLLRSEDGFHIWSQEYDREGAEIFSIQGDISTNIASVLKLKMIGTDNTDGQMAPRPIYPNFTAYELYLKARGAIVEGTGESLTDALTRLEKALQLESDYADAHIAMAETYFQLQRHTFYPNRNRNLLELARPHVEQALTVEPNHAGAHLMRGLIYQDLDLADREAAFRKSISLNPNLAQAHIWLGNVINLDLGLHTWTEAIPYFEKALEIEPLSVEAATFLVKYLVFVQQRQDEVEVIIGNLRARYPVHPQVSQVESDWLITFGRVAEVVPVLEEAIAFDPDNNGARIELSIAWYTLGEYERARQSTAFSRQWHWVMFPDREEALEQVAKFEESEYAFSAYVYVMLREWQKVLDVVPDNGLYVHKASNYSPGISMAVAYKKLGNEVRALELVEAEWDMLNIRSENGKLHNFQYSVVAARLYALEGRHYEATHELERLIKHGPNDPRELLHPVYDEMRGDPIFAKLLELQRTRINKERAKLELAALSPDDLIQPATWNKSQ